MANTSVRAKYVLFDKGGNWHFFEKTVYSAKEGVLIINILFELCRTFVSKTKDSVDLPVLMRPPKENNILWELNL
jgi:hypothetical protein